MELSVYAKKRTSKDGNKFYSYLSRLTRKDGSELPITVKFLEGCPTISPADCPCNIIVDKTNASLSQKKFEDEEGNTGFSYTLFVRDWEAGGVFIDHSLDDFAD